MSTASQIADMLGECIAEKAELQQSHDDLLEELSNLSDATRVAMLKANNAGAGYDIDGILESVEAVIAKAEKLK